MFAVFCEQDFQEIAKNPVAFYLDKTATDNVNYCIFGGCLVPNKPEQSAHRFGTHVLNHTRPCELFLPNYVIFLLTSEWS